jgi:hypothetical protein
LLICLLLSVFPLEPCRFPNFQWIGIPISQTYSKPDIMGSNAGPDKNEEFNNFFS